MPNKQTTLGAALVSALAKPVIPANVGDVNAVQAATPKAKQGKVKKTKLRDMHPQQYAEATDAAFAMMFDADRRVMVEEFAAIAEDHRYSEETTRAAHTELCGKIFPRGKATYNEVQAVGGYLKGISEYAYKCMIRAIKALPKMHGKLPSKDGGTKSGKRSTSPKIWYGSLSKELAKIKERMVKCPKRDIDADVLRKFNAALVAVFDAEKALAKRIKAA